MEIINKTVPDVETPYGYVYITINTINGKKYIGQHRANKYNYYLGSGAELKKAFKEFGRESFKSFPIAWATSEQELNALEKYYIEYFDATNSDEFYNIQAGGACRGTYDYSTEAIGRVHTEETKQKISNALKGRQMSDETKQKMSENHADVNGKNNPMYDTHRYGEENPMFGKKHSDETKQKIREKALGRTWSEERRKQRSEKLKGRHWYTNGINQKFLSDEDYNNTYKELGYKLGTLPKRKKGEN